MLHGLNETLEKIGPKYESIMIQLEDGHNPMHLAAWRGNLETVKILCKFTDNPNAPAGASKDESTPIHEAAIHGHLDIVKFLAII